MAASRQLAAIMFTDVAGFTDLAQADEAAALSLLGELDELARPILNTHHGRRVKSMGDGLLVEFPDALNAVLAAVALQQSLRERNVRPGARPLTLRVGIHLGDVQRLGDDIVGDAVNLASRVEPQAEPGGICLSEHVAVQVRNKVPYRLESLGARNLKGIRDPVALYRVILPWNERAAEAFAGGPPRLAVLPLANISPDPKDEYFADGLTEELISVLSRIHGLRVIARTSVSGYKTAPKPIRQVGTELGVGAVLEGSVRRSGDRLRITLQLIDATTEEHRWAETYDRTLADVFEIQAEIAERTAEAMKLQLVRTDRDAIRKAPVRNAESFEAYLRGSAAFQRSADAGWTREGVEESARYFEAAIALDPDSAAPRAHLANLYIAGMGETFTKSEVEDQVRVLVESAYRIDPNAPEVRVARGNYALQFQSDWSTAEQEFRAAVELNPSLVTAHGWLGILLSVLGRFDEAVREFEIGSELDPMFQTMGYWRIRVLVYARRTADALALADQLVTRDPGNRYLRVLRGKLLHSVGRRDEALADAALAQGYLGGAAMNSSRAELMVNLGDPAEARAIIAAWESGTAPTYYRSNFIAGLYTALGDREKALELLERDAVDGERSFWIDFRRSYFDAVRDDPRFVAIRERFHLPP